MIIINKRLILILLLTTCLTGCQNYSSSFGCSDAKGLNCRSLSFVDKQIDSGEIEEVEQNNCKGWFCRKNKAKIKPGLKMEKIYEVKLIPENSLNSNDILRPEDILYVE